MPKMFGLANANDPTRNLMFDIINPNPFRFPNRLMESRKQGDFH